LNGQSIFEPGLTEEDEYDEFKVFLFHLIHLLQCNPASKNE